MPFEEWLDLVRGTMMGYHILSPFKVGDHAFTDDDILRHRLHRYTPCRGSTSRLAESLRHGAPTSFNWKTILA